MDFKRWMNAAVLSSVMACGAGLLPSVAQTGAGRIQKRNYQQLFDNVGDRCYFGQISLEAAARDLSPRTPDSRSTTTGKPAASWRGTLGNGRVRKRAVSSVDDLALLSDIEFAKFKDDRLIVIGPAAAPGEGYRPEDWYVVMRAIAGTEAPGVTIDPGPDPKRMVVRYFGGIQQTALGQTFFEADRTLKIMSTGFDNVTCAPWPGEPKEIPTELDLVSRETGSAASDSGRWHRFWFEPSETPIETEGLAMRIPKARLIVKDEPVPPNSPSPKSARDFAAALTSNFLPLTKKIPVFRELQADAALVALAKWIRDKQVPVDDEWIKSAPGSSATPGSTPSITVVRAKMTDRVYLSYGIHGGVDLQRNNLYSVPTQRMRSLSAAADASRPAAAASWTFRFQDQLYQGLQLPIRNPAHAAPRWVVWNRDTAKNLDQPRPYTEAVPQSNFVVKNEGASELTVQISGDLTRTEHVAPGSLDAIRVVPGAYKLRMSSSCGTKDFSLTIAEREYHQLRYSCDASGPGAFMVNNRTDSPIIVNVAGISHTIAPGSTKINLDPGSYDATITSRCGTVTSHLEVTPGSVYAGMYSCQSR